MKDIFFGIFLLFSFSSLVQFWIWFLYLEKSKQVKLGDKNG